MAHSDGEDSNNNDAVAVATATAAEAAAAAAAATASAGRREGAAAGGAGAGLGGASLPGIEPGVLYPPVVSREVVFSEAGVKPPYLEETEQGLAKFRNC